MRSEAMRPSSFACFDGFSLPRPNLFLMLFIMSPSSLDEDASSSSFEEFDDEEDSFFFAPSSNAVFLEDAVMSFICVFNLSSTSFHFFCASRIAFLSSEDNLPNASAYLFSNLCLFCCLFADVFETVAASNCNAYESNRSFNRLMDKYGCVRGFLPVCPPLRKPKGDGDAPSSSPSEEDFPFRAPEIIIKATKPTVTAGTPHEINVFIVYMDNS
mmetsp:Transcript_461/g.1240  ORF Transcript_461/g.1240 Transcript_461/m.1240 type:complete len:214 (+) Transcript_461:551-1192(+)